VLWRRTREARRAEMRVLFGCLAVLLGAVSISLAARYGYKGADTEIDGVISGVVFGAIALCAFIFDAAAVRLWFMGHRIGAVTIGAISAAALVVTFTNSLGAIAGRADTTQAERARAKDDVAADRAELVRVVQERDALGQFPPATDETVTAARAAVTAAEQVRIAECEKRGPRCREREKEEEVKRDNLAVALANRALTVRAAELDADAKAIRVRIAKAPPVQHANPLGTSLALLIGAGAAALTAWQQAIVAAVFELCLVGVMVIYELLGHAKQPAQQEGVQSKKTSGGDPAKVPPPQEVKPLASPARRKAVTKANGSVKNFFRDHVIPADGERIEIKTLMRDYRAWCAGEKVTPLDVSALLDELEKLCRKLGIETKVGGDQRVYCLNVKVATDPAGMAVAVH
jgi:hypothetical protein